MDDQSKNLCYLLWSQKHPRSKWSKVLATWIDSSETRAKELLNGEKLSDKEQQELGKHIEISKDDLEVLILGDLFEKYRSQYNIWQENILYLLNEILRYGQQGELAERLNIGDEVISNWKKRKHIPAKKHKEEIQKFFKISSCVDLEKEPIFLLSSPTNIDEKKQWLQERIGKIDDRELDRLFPALEKLLAEE
ncbi:bacteriophage CI repressor [Pseudanabaena sp. UWO310]|uniref:bacteriophage CI repressor n=1 Tax=Pseudanabaena sp. UWO310 TaxID=2480795 RepID=UPI00115B9F0A|nr:bacteriophage CI repressor [Pseudanabaena sp. UWO310]TYQ30514.1 bacteriophage CI repressor [Pseudanabaena sp. UWO310]